MPDDDVRRIKRYILTIDYGVIYSHRHGIREINTYTYIQPDMCTYRVSRYHFLCGCELDLLCTFSVLLFMYLIPEWNMELRARDGNEKENNSYCKLILYKCSLKLCDYIICIGIQLQINDYLHTL